MPGIDLTNRKPAEERNKHPKPSNEGLKTLFTDVDTVIIKDDGVYNGRAMSDNILLTITDIDKVQMLHQLMEIDERNIGFYCMCLGTYAIELYSNHQLLSTIGFHHGISIRYDQWSSDAGLANIDLLVHFLADQGFTAPLAERTAQKRNMEKDRVAESKWLEIAPRCFSRYRAQIRDIDDSYYTPLIKDLNVEIPDRPKQIIALLQTFGKTDQFWSGYPSYEELPNDLLKRFEIEDIIAAYIQSDRNYKTRMGLGRFLCSFELKKSRKEHIKHITPEVIADLEKCFVWLGGERGINEIAALKKAKSKH